MPKKDPYGWGNFMDIGGDFLDFAKKDMGSHSGPKNKGFLNYVNEGDNQLYGDYTSRPVGRGGNRKGRPKISNNPNEFGISLQALGDSVMYSEISAGNAIRHGNKGRKARKERYEKEKQEKLKARGLKEGPTLGRTIYEKVKLANNKRQVKNQLKKYYHPKPKREERREEEPQRFRNQRNMR